MPRLILYVDCKTVDDCHRVRRILLRKNALKIGKLVDFRITFEEDENAITP